MGTRLGSLTAENTKCMVKVNGITLIERLLNQLETFHLSRIVIVTGFKGKKLQDFVATLGIKTEIVFVDNPVYDKTNNIYSLALASDEMCKDDTLLLESDIIVEDAVLKKVMNDKHPNVACVDLWQTWMDGTVVTLDDDNLIKKFIPKREFCFADAKTYYKTVNVYKFSKSFSQKDYIPFLKAYSLSLGNNEYYEQVLRVITLLGKPLVHAMPLAGEKWYEIDDEQDLDIAESIFCSQEEQLEKMAKRYGGYWRYPGMLDFCYLVTPHFPPQRMRDELKNSFDILMESYPSGQSVNSLVAAKTFGLRHEYVAVGNGAAELIEVYMDMQKGKVGFIYPTFEEYPNRIDVSRRVVFVPSPDDGFRYSAQDVMAFFDKNPVDTIILVNPDNPSGNFLSCAELKKIVSWAKKTRRQLLIDESFIDFAENRYTLLDNKFLVANRHVFVMKSISKSYGVPGLRLGIIASANTECLSSIRRHLSIWNINSFGEYFLQISEKYKADYRCACERMVSERRRFMSELATIPYLQVFPSAANYILCRVIEPFEPKVLAQRLWKEHRMLIKDCSSKKGFDGAKFIRLAVRNEKDNTAIVEVLKKFIV